MSGIWSSLREPIHLTLLPRPLVWERAPDDVQRRFEMLRVGGALEQPAASRALSPTHLRLVDHFTSEPLRFFRILPERAHAHAKFLAAIATSIISAGVNAPELIAIRDIGNAELALEYRWVDGAYPLSQKLDYFALGQAIAAFQRAIAPLDGLYPMAENTRRRLHDIEAMRRHVLAAHDWAESIGCPEAAENIRRFPELCRRMALDAALTHGDLNPANLVLNEVGFVFLDFEDVRHMRVWWGFDLAKIIERLILTREEEFGVTWARSAIANLLSGYLKIAPQGRKRQPDLGVALLEAMRWHLGLSLILILDSPNRQALAMVAEQAKLIGLSQLIEEKAGLLTELTGNTF